jgi:hypothetical protein
MFKEAKYSIIKRAVSEELARFCYDYFLKKRQVARILYDTRYISQYNQDWGVWNDEQVPNTYSHYGDVVMETLLEKLQPRIEAESELKLYPTYSYARIYKKGDVLHRHTDRYSCEVSSTMNLGGDPWELFIDPTGGTGKSGKAILMEPGDLVMYRGCDLEHWREEFEGENCGQVFFHYNDTSAKEANENKYDTRPFLGLPSEFKGIKVET